METPDQLRRRADLIESQQCTGLTASWCPIHGDCLCPRDEGGEHVDRYTGEPAMHDEDCPLHAPSSSHAEGRIGQ